MMEKEDLNSLKRELEQASNLIDMPASQAIKLQSQIDEEAKIDEWKKEKGVKSNLNEFELPRQLIKVLLSTNEHNGLLLYGEGGIGKTILTIEEIKSNLKYDEWVYSNGYITPLALYEHLYNHRNSKLIILDDLEGVFSNPVCVSILKGCLWDSDGKRIVQYSTTSNKATQLPSQFIINAKIIILCNRLPREDDSTIRAMVSRTISYELAFSYEQKLSICNQFILTDGILTESQKIKIIELLVRNTNPATKDFNFRTLRRLIAFIKYDELKAENLFISTLQEDEALKKVIELSKSGLSVNEQIALFIESIGKSRRTFFNLRKKICAKMQSRSYMDKK